MSESVEQKLNLLLKKAWRERWTDLMWGIYVKEIIPYGTSGDTHNMADCILKQALIGLSPNSLLLSYLKHSLSVQLVSYRSVIDSIIYHGSIKKTRCLLELLHLLENAVKYISCSGTAEECAALAASLLSLESWLWNIMADGLSKLSEAGTSDDYSIICHCASNLLSSLYEDKFLISLLYIGRCCSTNHPSSHISKWLNQTESNLKHLASSGQLSASNNELPESIKNILSLGRSFETMLFKEKDQLKPIYDNSLCTDVHILVSWEALLRPTSDGQNLTQQLEIVQKLRGYSATQLYCEILRACCLGLAETADILGELRWAVFTFLKAPALLLRLHRSIKGLDANTPISEPSADVAGAFERLLFYPGLLETTDAKCQCNIVEGLLNEVKTRTSLLSEWHVTSILSKRESLSRGGLKLETTNNQTATLVLRAEPTVTSILKTLDTDYAKNQDTLLKVLSHLLSGQSFELILNAATGTGKLKTFATKLVRFNEATRQPGGPDPNKTANVRALLFDISFLMLCRIAQMYGIGVILNGEQGKGTFFEQWASEWLKPTQAPDLSLSRCDSTVTDQLLKNLTSMEDSIDLRSGTVSWHEACSHVPAVIREVLIAYEAQLLTDEEVEKILDSLRSQMCCLPVCAAVWLRFYIQIQPLALRVKPTKMLDYLMTPMAQDDSKEHYRERSVLMLQVIRRVAEDDNSHTDIADGKDKSLDNQFATLWNKVLNQGWSNHITTAGIDRLYSVGGATWLITALVKTIIKEQSSERRQRCVEGAFSVAHLDLESCAISLATRVLPLLLTRSSNLASNEETGGPGGKALAQLAVYLFTSALNISDDSHENDSQKSSKSKRSVDRDFLGIPGFVCPPPKKMAVLNDEMDMMLSTPKSIDERKPVECAIASLMQLMTHIAEEGYITPQLAFISYFVQTLVESTCVKTKAIMKPLLSLIPPALLFYMLAIWPDLMSIADVAKLLAHPGDETGVGKTAAKIVCSFKSNR